ncbi:unnamed protein product (macronuclear) [Paramecium tetraurelia]|uniref:Myb-like domain-containing protein n=1 Tax=Paramecium tetraurelia TaxID=5888 RepID=A0DH38_PARTE|nr:uncharacterized protein GSPATT00016741001 [Paramecium tetraurelia]CAK82355.1 unnamed protein product [Paramecium tetraurelia]|eukprot:XP_001449752.1 hypothetical protein (macronuclear) [Paramecium tetraurelia strain d4-2]
MTNLLNPIKVEEDLEQQIYNPREQPIQSISTICSVKQLTEDLKFKIPTKKIRRKTASKMYKNGHWTQKEHNLYLQFIETNKAIMMKSHQKKQEKIFKQMSLVIKTRSPSQCRSHHQKFNPF